MPRSQTRNRRRALTFSHDPEYRRLKKVTPFLEDSAFDKKVDFDDLSTAIDEDEFEVNSVGFL